MLFVCSLKRAIILDIFVKALDINLKVLDLFVKVLDIIYTSNHFDSLT